MEVARSGDKAGMLKSSISEEMPGQGSAVLLDDVTAQGGDGKSRSVKGEVAERVVDGLAVNGRRPGETGCRLMCRPDESSPFDLAVLRKAGWSDGGGASESVRCCTDGLLAAREGAVSERRCAMRLLSSQSDIVRSGSGLSEVGCVALLSVSLCSRMISVGSVLALSCGARADSAKSLATV